MLTPGRVLARKAQCRHRLAVRRAGIAIGVEFGVVELGCMFAEIRVGRQTVVALVEFRDQDRNAITRLQPERAFAKCAAKAKITFERGRAVADHAKQVGHAAKLFVHCFKHRLGSSRRGSDRGWGFDARHRRLRWYELCALTTSLCSHFAIATMSTIDKTLLRFIE